MAKPTLSERIEAWFEGLPIVGRIAAWVIDWQHRRQEVQEELVNVIVDSFKQGQIGRGLLAVVYSAFYTLLGDIPWLGTQLQEESRKGSDELEAFTQDPQGYLREKLNAFGTSPETRAFTEFIGTIITEPVVSLLESYASDPDPDPHAMARSFHGIASGLPWAAETLDSVLRTVLGERAPSVGKNIMALYWGLGLGFLGWQTLAPLLSSGLQPNLEAYYNKLYRPARFNPGQAMDLFALGEVGEEYVRETLRGQGWRDEDIQYWLDLSFRQVPESIYWDLFEKGQITKPQMDERLRASGYNPADFDILYAGHEPEEKAETTRFLISTVKDAFKNGRMSEDEFRSILSEQRYDTRIIDLLVQQLTLEKETEERLASEGDIKLLYTQRVIAGDEATHYLEELGYTAEIAGKLVKAWDSQALPKAARINKDTILEAFTKGVFTRAEAKSKLQVEAGYTADQAELLVKIEETPVPEKVTPPEVGALTLAQIEQLVSYGLVTRAEVEVRSEFDKYDEETKKLLIDLMFLKASQEVTAREVPQGIIEEAYVFGFITREELKSRLVARGFTEEDAELTILTLEAEHPEVFAEVQPELLRMPGVGDLQLALQRGLIDEAGFRSRLTSLGYSEDAVTIFLFNAQYQLPAQPKLPSKADVTRWYKTQIISRAEFQRRLTQIGYLSTDIDLYVQDVGLKIEDTLAFAFWAEGLLDDTGFFTAITELGFTPDEIEEFLAAFEAGEIVV